MKNILLVCAGGMSTSMLVKRMIEHANAISFFVIVIFRYGMMQHYR